MRQICSRRINQIDSASLSLYRQDPTSIIYQTMLGLSAIRHSIARSGGAASNCNYSAAIRALSTNTESLKVGSAATSTPPPSATKEENIKYFKIYRWDPDHQQKPVSIDIINVTL